MKAGLDEVAVVTEPHEYLPQLTIRSSRSGLSRVRRDLAPFFPPLLPSV